MTPSFPIDGILSLQDVAYYYLRKVSIFKKEQLWVLKKITLDILPGETMGVIGKNGCGKTTLLKLIAGILEPDKGMIQRNDNKISLLSLGTGFIPYLSGRENTFLNGMILGIHKEEIKNHIEAIKLFSGLGEHFEYPIRTYSNGMIARLGFSIALQLDTDIFLVDEVLGVGDGEFRRK